jgi:hypothetical protein
METTILSTVQETKDGILLRPAELFPETSLDQGPVA